MVAISILESASAVHAGGGALVWLGIALLALAASAAGVFWWLRSGATRVGAAERAATGALPLTCPACRRSYPTGTIYCPIDASRVVASRDGAVAERGAGGKCPRCRRVYDGATRFCAVDAEELVPLPLWPATHAEGGLHVDTEEAAAARAGAVHFHGEGKICPVCAAKYDLEASFCGRDGSELVTVN